jgi:hypothetical protein
MIVPLAAYNFVTRAGCPPLQAAVQGANEEITRSMVRTREVIELAPDAFFQADLDGRFTDVNQAACRLLGHCSSTIPEAAPEHGRPSEPSGPPHLVDYRAA